MTQSDPLPVVLGLRCPFERDDAPGPGEFGPPQLAVGRPFDDEPGLPRDDELVLDPGLVVFDPEPFDEPGRVDELDDPGLPELDELPEVPEPGDLLLDEPLLPFGSLLPDDPCPDPGLPPELFGDPGRFDFDDEDELPLPGVPLWFPFLFRRELVPSPVFLPSRLDDEFDDEPGRREPGDREPDVEPDEFGRRVVVEVVLERSVEGLPDCERPDP